MQDVVQPIARNLRRLRTERNLSISALADRAGVSKSTLSNLERGIGNPSIDTLWAVARVLGVPFATLFEEDDPTGVEVLRFQDAPMVPRPGGRGGGSGSGYTIRHLDSWRGRSEVEAYIVDLDDEGRRSAGPHASGVVEHVIVVSGSVDIGGDQESVVLGPGDRIRFPADRKHHYKAVDGPARVIALLDYP